MQTELIISGVLLLVLIGSIVWIKRTFSQNSIQKQQDEKQDPMTPVSLLKQSLARLTEEKRQLQIVLEGANEQLLQKDVIIAKNIKNRESLTHKIQNLKEQLNNLESKHTKLSRNETTLKEEILQLKHNNNLQEKRIEALNKSLKQSTHLLTTRHTIHEDLTTTEDTSPTSTNSKQNENIQV